MSKNRRWAVLVSAGAIASACQLGLDERACSVSDTNSVCLEGWSCCEDNVCRQDCAGGSEDPAPETGVSDDPPPTASAPASSMALILGDTPYRYACQDGGGGSIASGDDNGGMGPVFSTQTTSANAPDCPWPTSEPGLWIDVMFRNFQVSEGLPLGTWDLADPESILAFRVEFIASVEDELPVGQKRPFQYYDSTTPLEGAEGPIPGVTYQGFYQSPLASGSLTVSRLPGGEHAGGSPAADELGLYVIELSDVTLGATNQAEPNPAAPYPPTVTLSSATLTFSLTNIF